jgi:hypothetical protein
MWFSIEVYKLKEVGECAHAHTYLISLKTNEDFEHGATPNNNNNNDNNNNNNKYNKSKPDSGGNQEEIELG